ncbi:MAG: hypothetical protein HN467_09800 [Opitutae bacterium]|nr:hypothetical protein [Opitutae bacterium]
MSKEQPPIIEFPPANIWMRIAAYGMDMLLILAILWAIRSALPTTATAFLDQMQTEQIPFGEMLTLSQEFVEKNPNAATQLMMVSTLSLLTPLLYFLLSEILLSGCTLGKKTFNLRTAYRNSPRLPPIGAQAIRSIVKSIASFALISHNPLLIIFLGNFLIAFYNPDRKAGHDILSRTNVVPGYLPEVEPENKDPNF